MNHFVKCLAVFMNERGVHMTGSHESVDGGDVGHTHYYSIDIHNCCIETFRSEIARARWQLSPDLDHTTTMKRTVFALGVRVLS